MTCGFRNCQSRACGSTVRPDGHELAYCVAHEAIARHLPTLRSARCCTSEGCGRPQGSRSPLCKSCRPRYSAWGLDGYPVPQEAPMPTTPLSKLPDLGFARIQVQTTGASLADLEAAVAKVTPPAAPQDAADGGATPSPEAVAGSIDWRALRVQWQIRVRIGLVYDITSLKFVSESLANGRMTGSDEAHAVCDGAEVAPWMPIGSAAVLAARMVAVHAALTTPKPESGPACTAIDGKPCVCYAREGDCPHMPGSVDYTSGTLDRATAPPATVEEFLRDLESGDGEPSEGDVADAPLFVGGTDSAPELVARWGQVHTAPVQPMSADLAALAARGQQPTAPGPTLAEVQAELARERERADRAELDAVAERARADEAMEELATIAAMLDPGDAPAFDSDDQPIPLPVRVQVALMPHSESVLVRGLRAERDSFWGIINDTEWIAHVCGSYGATASLADRVLRLLPVERQRAILELQRAEAYIDVARINARFMNPPPPEKLAEAAAKVAEVEAKIAALDAGEVQK